MRERIVWKDSNCEFELPSHVPPLILMQSTSWCYGAKNWLWKASHIAGGDWLSDEFIDKIQIMWSDQEPRKWLTWPCDISSDLDKFISLWPQPSLVGSGLCWRGEEQRSVDQKSARLVYWTAAPFSWCGTWHGCGSTQTCSSGQLAFNQGKRWHHGTM